MSFTGFVSIPYPPLIVYPVPAVTGSEAEPDLTSMIPFCLPLGVRSGTGNTVRYSSVPFDISYICSGRMAVMVAIW